MWLVHVWEKRLNSHQKNQEILIRRLARGGTAVPPIPLLGLRSGGGPKDPTPLPSLDGQKKAENWSAEKAEKTANLKNWKTENGFFVTWHPMPGVFG